jgi:hypothetical protein
MLDQADIQVALLEVCEAARAAGRKVALAGGVALQRLGSDRFTSDVDFIADAPLPGYPERLQLSFGGYGTTTRNGVKVDLIIRDDAYRALYEEALLYARVSADGVPIVSPEYLAAMKLVARRGKDRADLQFMIAAKAFDVPKARRIIKRTLGAYAAEDFDAFVQVARWEMRKG